MINEDKITEIFYLADDFYKYFSSELKNIRLAMGRFFATNQPSFPISRLSQSIIMFYNRGADA